VLGLRREGTSTVASKHRRVGAELSTLGRAGLISDRLSEFASAWFKEGASTAKHSLNSRKSALLGNLRLKLARCQTRCYFVFVLVL
jgi:hypothetical protein